VDACGIFDGILERDVFSWNVKIAAYRKQGFSEEALALFHQCNEMEVVSNLMNPPFLLFFLHVPAQHHWNRVLTSIEK